MNAAGAVDVLLERLRRIASTHWANITIDPLIEIWSLAPALIERLSLHTPHVPDEDTMPSNTDIEEWLADAESHARFMRESTANWQAIAERWQGIAERASVGRETRRQTHLGALAIADGHARAAEGYELTAQRLRALLAEGAGPEQPA